MDLADVLAELKEMFKEPYAATYQVVVTSDTWSENPDRLVDKAVVAIDVDHEAGRICIYYAE